MVDNMKPSYMCMTMKGNHAMLSMKWGLFGAKASLPRLIGEAINAYNQDTRVLVCVNVAHGASEGVLVSKHIHVRMS